MCSPKRRSRVARDGLVGLKENVIIGKLIPAGTGMPRYRDIKTDAPDYEPLPFYSSDSDLDGDLDLAAWLADSSAGASSRRQGSAWPGSLTAWPSKKWWSSTMPWSSKRSPGGDVGDATA